MKKIGFLSLLLAAFIHLHAQGGFTLTEGVPSLVYSLPKTELRFEVWVERRTETPGIFFTQAQRYLGTNKIITEEKTTYTLKSVEMLPHTLPDPNRRFLITPTAGAPINRIVVDEQGILYGFNIPKEDVQSQSASEKSMSSEPLVVSKSELLPLTREFMIAGTSAKLAEGAAAQIYDIRASRLNLLSGDMENFPSHESIQLMLRGLDQKESELTALFVGSVTVELEKHVISFIPEKDKLRDVLFRLSSLRGLVAKDDLGGEPFHLTLLPERIPVQALEVEAKPRRTVDPIGLYTVIPAKTQVRLTDGVNTLLEQTLFIPQLGELTGISETMLRTPQLKIKIHKDSGRLLKMDF